jgi:hypothetical protein
LAVGGNSIGGNDVKRVKRTLVTLGTCAVLSTAPLATFAHGDEAGAAFAGGILGGLIGSAVVGGPVYPAYAPPVVVERYAPPPVVVERRVSPPIVVERYEPVPVYGLPRVYYGDGGWHRRHWHDDDDD